MNERQTEALRELIDEAVELISKATSWIGGTNAVCYDSNGRECKTGADMKRAEQDGAFPVHFWLGKGSQTKAEQRKSKRNAKAIMKLMYPWRF